MWARLSTHLQAVEADFMFNGWVPAMQDEGIDVITIHDAVMVKKSNEERAKELFWREVEARRLAITLGAEEELPDYWTDAEMY